MMMAAFQQHRYIETTINMIIKKDTYVNRSPRPGTGADADWTRQLKEAVYKFLQFREDDVVSS